MSPEDIQNRFAFHPATTEEKRAEHGSVRHACAELADFINEHVPDGREKSLAITNLEQVMFWANAGLARPQPESGPSIREALDDARAIAEHAEALAHEALSR